MPDATTAEPELEPIALRLRSLGPGQVEACSQPFAPGHLPGPAAVDCAAHYEAIADPRLELGVP